MRRFILGWKVLGYAQRFSAEIVNYADDFCVLGKATAILVSMFNGGSKRNHGGHEVAGSMSVKTRCSRMIRTAGRGRHQAESVVNLDVQS